MTAMTHEHLVALEEWLNSDDDVVESIDSSVQRAIDELGLPFDESIYTLEIKIVVTKEDENNS